MPLKRKPMRYAHPEGHTDVCYYTGKKGGLITCGSDGDVRSWLNLTDDDPASSCIAEQAISVISKDEKIYVGNDNNIVQILTYSDLEKEGIVTRFTAAVCALSTATNSNYIVSGGCDMRIQVTDISTSYSIELEGHKAPILGLSLDPKEEFVASSSADGSLRVWNIKEKRTVNVWNNIVPKSNSFFTAKAYCVPSFHSKDGRYLAYPYNKDVVIVERLSWKELYKLKCPNLKTELSICKFSECATKIAASSVYGEIVVWDSDTKEIIGYIEHEQNIKITGLAWQLNEPNEIAFCDISGQLGCIDVISTTISKDETFLDCTNGNLQPNNALESENEDDDDEENVISLNKIKASVNIDNDKNGETDSVIDRDRDDIKTYVPEVHLQSPFQPGSSPDHLLSRFMVWNDTGMVRCFNSENEEESSIEVEFHDVTIHRSIHINNYLKHRIAALSPQALALNCPSSEDTASKMAVIVLQGWGSGNKEWAVDLPEGEEGQCIAAGDNFIAIATSKRYLRIFMIGGTQREIIALPGPVVTMNALGNYLVAAYHNGVGVSGDQHMNLFWIRVQGPNLRNQTLSVPLAPSSDLMWLGLSDLGSPVIMNDDVIKIYDKKSSLWKVVCDTDRQGKGKADHYFVIGVSEQNRSVRCVLCKGSYYPATTPRPVVTEIFLTIPLCEPESEKTEKEMKLWQLGSHPFEENEIILSLIALACRNNVEYRAIELCEQIASQKVVDLAIKYATRLNRIALAKKFESIADIKDQEEKDTNNQDEFVHHDDTVIDDTEEVILTPIITKKSEIEIKPLSMNDTLSIKRNNPFLRNVNSITTKGLGSLDTVPDKSQKLAPVKSLPTKSKSKVESQKVTFVSWYAKNKKYLQEEFPNYTSTELTKISLTRYKEEQQTSKNIDEGTEGKKRKLSDPEADQNSQPKRSFTEVLNTFAADK